MWSDNESTEDFLGFQYLADAIVSIVKNENLLPATIGVFGDWGGGKSTSHRNCPSPTHFRGGEGSRGCGSLVQWMAF